MTQETKELKAAGFEWHGIYGRRTAESVADELRRKGWDTKIVRTNFDDHEVWKREVWKRAQGGGAA